MRSVSRFLYLLALLLLATFEAEAGSDSDVLAVIRQLVADHHYKQPVPASFSFNSLEELDAELLALDPYSKRLESRNKSIISESVGQSSGFGIDLLPMDGRILVIPRKNGRLYQAGIHDQRDLDSIDGVVVAERTLHDIGELLQRAAAAGQVRLGLRLNPNAQADVLSLAPASTPRLPVEVIDDNGKPYIRIHGFIAHQTHRLLTEAIRSLIRSRDTVILDLRYASGGDLFEVLDTASLFLSDDYLLASVVDGKGQRQAYYALPDQKIVSQPIIILTGPVTASASEVLVRALKSHGVAVVVGGETYGKCLSQRIFSLPDGSRLRLSNQRILDPAGVYCEGKGIVPDVEVQDNDVGNTQELIRRGLKYLHHLETSTQFNALPYCYRDQPCVVVQNATV